MISIAGSDHGRIKINQDSYFTIPKVENCENVKIFGKSFGNIKIVLIFVSG